MSTGKITENKTQHDAVIEVKDVTKNFVVGKNTIQALKKVDLVVSATDFMVIFGPSGCGKSTLLNIILGLDKPTAGEVEIRGKKINLMSEDERAAFRAEKIGMVYQMPYWIKSLNVLENVSLPLLVRGLSQGQSLIRAKEVLADLNLSDFSGQFPTQLSGGQQQRVGLARAIVTNPWILMADEPTGNLDSKSGEDIMKLFLELNKKHKRTIVLVTHNEDYWNFGNRRVEMSDGEIIEDKRHG
ncbi:MAG: ABC transporter ATP-binding protein [Candidatus Berkelbacteria bacterium]|nr:ABC transporter ATP-binding protein [Candidatus Berkelbacteria bacterium]